MEFSNIRVDTVREVHGELPDTEVVQYKQADGLLVGVGELALHLGADCKVKCLRVEGIAEDGNSRSDHFTIDDYPDELVPLVAKLLLGGSSRDWG